MGEETEAPQGSRAGAQITPWQKLALWPLWLPHCPWPPNSLNPTVSLKTALHPCPLGADGPMKLLPAGHRFFQFMLC